MNYNKYKHIFLSVLLILLLISTFILGYLSRQWYEVHNAQFSILQEAYSLLAENGIVPLPSGKVLEYGMIKGMLQAYNEPHTVFVEPPQHELETDQLAGKYAGIGARLDRDNQNNIVIYPLPESPALAAGIKDNDLLVQVGDLKVEQDTDINEVEAALRGAVNEPVKVSIIRRPDENVQIFSIPRKEIGLPSVTYNLAPQENRVGVIQIHVIAETTPDEVTKAINQLKTNGAQFFVIDLRDNGGGLVDSAVDTARLFLKDGIVMQQQYKGKPVDTFDVKEPGAFSDMPIAILVNHGTASAAEILSGALKSHRRAKIIGVPTFGKDTIQLVFDLQDKSSLHVTSAHWWIPELDPPIQGHGLIPDVVISDDKGNGPAALEAAITALLITR